MAGGSIKQLLHKFRSQPMLMQIIGINIAVFLLLRLAAIVGMFTGLDSIASTLMGWLELPSYTARFIVRPWTLVTYMFTQWDVMHILFNLLWLYWFGTLFTMAATPRQLLALYILGGLGGGLLFMLGYNLLPHFRFVNGVLIGSSASVMAIVTATAIMMPDFRMNLLLFGSVRLKWIAIATIVLVLIGVTGANAGGEMAHIGGMAVGAAWALGMRRGRDFTRPVCRLFDRIANIRVKPTRPVPPHRRDNRSGLSDTDRATLDAILEKVKKSGYTALTPEEKRLLFDISRNIR